MIKDEDIEFKMWKDDDDYYGSVIKDQTEIIQHGVSRIIGTDWIAESCCEYNKGHGLQLRVDRDVPNLLNPKFQDKFHLYLRREGEYLAMIEVNKNFEITDRYKDKALCAELEKIVNEFKP